ncbi:MAG: hypothetical protein RL199_289 [Pseudomonadota bacterium]|jgi:hypothetical protein
MAAVGLANPALWWGALAAAVPVAIHLLSRRRSRKQPFAAVHFLLRSRKERTRRIRLRHLLLMLVRAAVLAALGLAVARPLWRPRETSSSPALSKAATALVLDASFSMRLVQGGRPLMERAKSEAARLVESLPSESAATLVVCDGRPMTPEAPHFDRIALKRKIEAAEASFLSADMGACVSAAASALAESPLEAKRLYVLTDLAASSLSAGAAAPRVPTPSGEVVPDVVFVDAADGRNPSNRAIVDLAVASSPALGARGYEVTVTVKASGPEGATNLPVALKVGDEVVTRGFVDVPPGGSARKTLSHRFEPGDVSASVVLDGDDLPADDGRTFVLHVPRDVRALVVDGSPAAVRTRDEAWFVETALGPARTGGRVTATFLDADAAATRNLSDFDAVLLLNVPAPRPGFVASLRGFVEAGGGLFLSAGDQVDPDAWNAAFGDLLPRPLHLVHTMAEPDAKDGPPPARFARVDFTHPAFALFEGVSEGFDSAKIFRSVLLQPDPRQGERVLAALDDGSPAIVEASRGAGRVILYTSTVDLDWTDWPIRTSFLPAVQQLTQYLGRSRDERPPAAAKVGEKRPLALAEGTTLVEVRGPDGHAVRPVDGGLPVEAPGLYSVRVSRNGETKEAPELSFAAALDARESDVSRRALDELQRQYGGEEHALVAGGAAAALPTSGTPLWPWLLVTMVAALAIEGVLVRRA